MLDQFGKRRIAGRRLFNRLLATAALIQMRNALLLPLIGQIATKQTAKFVSRRAAATAVGRCWIHVLTFGVLRPDGAFSNLKSTQKVSAQENAESPRDEKRRLGK